MNMIKDWRLLLFFLTLVLIPACWVTDDSPTPDPIQPVQDSTITSIPITNTPERKIETPTIIPTDTQEPTAPVIPPTHTPEPLLPLDLSQIGSANVKDLQILSGLPIKEIYALAFSQTGNKLVTLSEHWEDRSDYLGVWDLTHGDQTLFLENLNAPWNPYFSPDENQLFISYANRGIEVYDLVRGQLDHTLEIIADRTAFSPDGTYIATSSFLAADDTSTTRITDLAGEQERFAVKTPGLVMYIQFSPDGKHLIGGFQVSNHFREYVWDLSTQDQVADFIDYDTQLTFSPDGDLAATAKGGKIYIFNTKDWVLINSYGFEDPYSNVKPKDFSRAGDILAVEDRYDVIFLETDTGEELLRLDDECDVRFSPQGTSIFTWCYQGEINIWGVTP